MLARDDLPIDGKRASRVLRQMLAVLAAALASRLVVLAIAYVESRVSDAGGPLSTLCRWDCIWYELIIGNGYDPAPPAMRHGEANWAFFPAFPLLARGVLALTGLTPAAAAVVTSNLVFLASCPLLHGYVKRFYGAALAFDTVLLASFSPFSLYYSTGYGESLFLLATIASLWCWEDGKYLLGGSFGALAAATRSVGIFILFAFVVVLVMQRRSGTLPALKRDAPRMIVGLGIVPLGLALFMIHLYYRAGDALAFARVQIAWKTPSNSWEMMLEGLRPIGPYIAATGAATALCVGLGAYLAGLRRYGDAAFLIVGAVAALILKLSSGTGTGSMVRIAFGLFPVYIGIVALLTRLGLPRWLYLSVAAGFLGFYATAWAVEQYFVI